MLHVGSRGPLHTYMYLAYMYWAGISLLRITYSHCAECRGSGTFSALQGRSNLLAPMRQNSGVSSIVNYPHRYFTSAQRRKPTATQKPVSKDFDEANRPAVVAVEKRGILLASATVSSKPATGKNGRSGRQTASSDPRLGTTLAKNKPQAFPLLSAVEIG